MSALGPLDGNPAPTQAAAGVAFYASIHRRLMWMMALLAIVGTAVLWFKFERTMALSFLAGSCIAILNFYWLRRTLEAMADRLQASGERPSAFGVLFRFSLRYVLIAAAAYVIFKSTANSLYGLFAGLFLPVGAILIEAVYEIYRTFRTEL